MLLVAVRVRIKIRSRRSGCEREVVALVNSGFETERYLAALQRVALGPC